MSKWLPTVFVLFVGYVLGLKFQGLGKKLGIV